MIRSFRKFRKKLFQDQKTKGYILYALGEIFLIVLGILIAFQINQWNEKRKLDRLGNELLEEIRSGVQSDIQELEVLIYFYEDVFKSQTAISNWIAGNQKFNDSLSVHLCKIYRAIDFKSNDASFETLKKFGLRRISNEKLRHEISGLYEAQYPRFIKYTEIYMKFLEMLLLENSKHFNEINYLATTMYPLNADHLQKDQQYAYNLNSLKNVNQLLLAEANYLLANIKKIQKEF